MANRYAQQKPDPAIRKSVTNSRRGGYNGKGARGLVVASSLAATLMGWALFSHQDAESAATAIAQVSATNTPALTAQQLPASSPTPIVTSVQLSPTSQSATQPTSTAAALTATATQAAPTATAVVPSSSAPAAVARTRSSR